jgi:hypothetical protein
MPELIVFSGQPAGRRARRMHKPEKYFSGETFFA